MQLQFRLEDTTQAAARLLKLRGGTMSYLKLIKLLYLADRKALLTLGRPITFDRYVSMKHGPVLSQTYDLIVGEESPGEHGYWREFISEPTGYDVRLLKEAPDGALSVAQQAILDEIFAEFGRMRRWDIVHYTHTLPEWEDPNGSSIPIALRDVLRGVGLEEDDADAVAADLAGEDALVRLLQ